MLEPRIQADILRLHFSEGLSRRQIARKLKVHRLSVGLVIQRRQVRLSAAERKNRCSNPDLLTYPSREMSGSASGGSLYVRVGTGSGTRESHADPGALGDRESHREVGSGKGRRGRGEDFAQRLYGTRSMWVAEWADGDSKFRLGAFDVCGGAE